MRYHDRRDGGRVLARALAAHAQEENVIVLALPRGGVPVGFEVAHALGVPFDVFLVRKLGVPGHEELAMGAIASGGVRFMNADVLASLDLPKALIEEVVAREQRELERREREYRDGRPPPHVRNRTVILVDDGLATGASMHAAARAMYLLGVKRVIVAVPVAAAATCRDLARVVDEVVCPLTPEPFYAVGLWYDNFEQTTDDEVRALLSNRS
ncbi:MAG: phosphoribosyltransferase [Longimicrobiales bacterium]